MCYNSGNMKNRPTSVRIHKKIIKISLIVVIFIIFLSIVLLMSTLLPKEKSSLENVGYSFGSANTHMHRKFKIESKEEGLYNIGEYRVNLDSNKHLTLNLSLKCTGNAFGILLKNSVLIQNAVIDTFATYGSIYLPNTLPGKERLKIKIKQKVNDAFEDELIEEVFFNKYLIR